MIILDVCLTGWKSFQERCYKVFSETKTWPEAKRYCESVNGNLASITSEQINDFITDLVAKSGVEYPWIGGKLNCDFEWTDGTPFDFTKWDIQWDGQPNECTQSYGCVEIVNGKWHDFRCNFQRAFICQKMSMT